MLELLTTTHCITGVDAPAHKNTRPRQQVSDLHSACSGYCGRSVHFRLNMRFLKRLLRIFALVLLLCALAAGVLYHLSTRMPAGYTPAYLTDAQIAEAARIVDTQKFPRLLNLASEARNNANLAVKSGTTQAAIVPLTITFTQDELNASLWKWTNKHRASYEPYVKQPLIKLEEGRIILMGTVPEYDKVLSVHLVPAIDEQGLHCTLDSVRIGTLPLPQGLFNKQRARVEASLKARLPAWQSAARMDATGVTNSDFDAAATARMVLQILDHKPSPAILLLPKLDSPGKSIPVRLTHLQVEQGALTITVQPLQPEERLALLETVKPSPQAGAD